MQVIKCSKLEGVSEHGELSRDKKNSALWKSESKKRQRKASASNVKKSLGSSRDSGKNGVKSP